MIEFEMNLSSINDVKDFVNTVSRYDFDVDLISGRYIVDAKSIMGIFSLNITKPLTMKIDNVHLVSQHSMKELLEKINLSFWLKIKTMKSLVII